MNKNNPSSAQQHIDALREQGYCVVPDIIGPDLVSDLQEHMDTLAANNLLKISANNFEGFHTGRLFNLLKYDAFFEQITLNKTLLAIGEGIFDEGLLLSSISGLVIHPGETAQPIHADTQLLNLARPHVPISLTCMVAISDYTAENGATRLVPKSHRYPSAPEYGQEVPEALAIEFSAGSALLFDSQVWHGGGANTSDKPRVGLAMAYCAGWTRPQENLLLGLSDERMKSLPRRLQELLGYSIYKGQWGHIERQDPIEMLGKKAGRGMVWDATERVASQKTTKGQDL